MEPFRADTFLLSVFARSEMWVFPLHPETQSAVVVFYVPPDGADAIRRLSRHGAPRPAADPEAYSGPRLVE